MPTTEILDEATYMHMLDSLGGDVDFLCEMVEAYFASTPELLSSMRKALVEGNAPGLQRAAHSLKSGSAGFGALALATLCKELEDMGRMGALNGAGGKLSDAELAYSEVVAALQAKVQGGR